MTSGRPPIDETASPFQLVTLGGASLRSGSTPVLGPGKPLALVAYLALAPGRSASREFLLDLLWADLDHDRGRHALRQTVWQLRQLLGEQALEGRQEMTLGLPVDADRDRFLGAVESNDPERAVALYTGPFLPAFALPGSSAFEHWADTERVRLRGIFLRAAETVTRRLLAAGRFREAQDSARRMRDADPMNEPGWRLLLEALLASRDVLQATIEADALAALCTAEGRHPEPATRALLAELRSIRGEALDGGQDGGSALLAELVGREAEFATLLDGWQSVARGSARHYHVSAAAGLGKTRLLNDLAHRLRSLGAKVVSVRAHPGDRAVSYATAGDLARALGALPGLAAVSPGAADALVGLSPTLASRFPNARPARAAAEPLRLRTAALAEALAAVADEQPLALLLDDTHWLDPESRQLVDGILHRLDGAPVLVVTTGRPGVGRSLEGPGTVAIELRPLDEGGVASLFGSLGRTAGGDLAASIAARLHRASGGSPLLVMESIQLALERGTLSLSDGVWGVPSPEALLAELDAGRAMSARVTGLDQGDRWVLLLLATAGTPLSAGELRSGLRTPDALEEHLWSLERRALIHRTGESWEPGHDEIAAVALDAAAPDQRAAAHRAVATLLASGQPSVDRLLEACRHADAAGDHRQLGLLFRRSVGQARAAGDPRSTSLLAATALGERASRPAIATLSASLPLRVRIGLHSRARQVVAAGLVGAVAATGAWLATRTPETPDARLLVMVPSRTGDSLPDVVGVPVSAKGWRAEVPLKPRAGRRRFPAQAPNAPFAVGRDGSIYFARFIDNDRTDDIQVVRPGQSPASLVGFDRDDGFPMISPDQGELALTTSQWSPRGHDDYDIGVLDLASGALRRVTSTPDHDRQAVWSPSGTVVAFGRTPRDLRPLEVCWAATGPSLREACRPIPFEWAEVVGFADDENVILNTTRADTALLVRWNLARDRFDEVWALGEVRGPVISPDGHWLACHCALRRGLPPTPQVLPMADPAAARPLTIPSALTMGWQPIGPGEPSVIEIGALPPIPVLTSQRLSLTLLRGGRPRWIPEPAITWSVDDTTVAAVRPGTNILDARAPGRTMVRAAAGRLTAAMPVTVSGDSAEILLEEPWDQLDSTVWRPFGVPPPVLVRHADGTRGINNGGDGSYASGLYSRAAWPLARGLAVEARLSLPIDRSQWQVQSISLVPDLYMDTEGWDGITGSPRAIGSNTGCSFSYPKGEGPAATLRVSWGPGTGPGVGIPVDTMWRLGAWHRVLLQIFPDGSCGLAIDGTPLARSPPKMTVDRPYLVWLSGNSADTDRLIVGPLWVWRGIRPEIDWSKLDPPEEQEPHADQRSQPSG